MPLLPFVVSALFTSGGCNLEPAPKAYALVTVKHDETRIQMVAIMEISSTDECETAYAQFMERLQRRRGSVGWRQTEEFLPADPRAFYQKVMNRETFHATYLVFSPRNDWEMEGRIVLYGIPSSQAQEICHRSRKRSGAPGRRSGVRPGNGRLERKMNVEMGVAVSESQPR
jgi:hypothetical protein